MCLNLSTLKVLTDCKKIIRALPPLTILPVCILFLVLLNAVFMSFLTPPYLLSIFIMVCGVSGPVMMFFAEEFLPFTPLQRLSALS